MAAQVDHEHQGRRHGRRLGKRKRPHERSYHRQLGRLTTLHDTTTETMVEWLVFRSDEMSVPSFRYCWAMGACSSAPGCWPWENMAIACSCFSFISAFVIGTRCDRDQLWPNGSFNFP